MVQGVRLSDDQIEAVAESLGRSPSWRAAADYAGVNERTLARYRERHDAYANRPGTDQTALSDLPDKTDPDAPYYKIVQRWIAARAELEKTLVNGVLDAIPKDWKAAHAMLKSGWPKDYSERVELTGAGGGPIEVSSDELRAQIEQDLARIAAKREAAGESLASADAPRAGNDPQPG